MPAGGAGSRDEAVPDVENRLDLLLHDIVRHTEVRHVFFAEKHARLHLLEVGVRHGRPRHRVVGAKNVALGMLLMFLFSFSEQSSALPSADMAAESRLARPGRAQLRWVAWNCSQSFSSTRLGCKVVLGAVEPDPIICERRVHQRAVVRRRARADVGAEVRAGDAHAAHRDETLVLEGADHLHDAREERSLLLRSQVRHGAGHELRPRPRTRTELSTLLVGVRRLARG